MKRPSRSFAAVSTRASERDRSRVSEYRLHRNKVGEELLRAVLRALAATEAADMVNDLLERKLNLTGVSIERREFDARVLSVLRAEIATVLVRNSALPPALARRMTGRIVAQMFPTRDDTAGTPALPARSERLRVEDLESIIRRETRRTKAGTGNAKA